MYAWFSETYYKQISYPYQNPNGVQSYGSLYQVMKSDGSFETILATHVTTGSFPIHHDDVLLAKVTTGDWIKLADASHYTNPNIRHEAVTVTVNSCAKKTTEDFSSLPDNCTSKAKCATKIKVSEKPCRCCSKMNDYGVRTCWMCGADNP